MLSKYASSQRERQRAFFAELLRFLNDDWDENLSRLNRAINRRVASLKSMETELEETIRMAFAQYETEAIIFEQVCLSSE
jgi:hypothetical protein